MPHLRENEKLEIETCAPCAYVQTFPIEKFFACDILEPRKNADVAQG